MKTREISRAQASLVLNAMKRHYGGWECHCWPFRKLTGVEVPWGKAHALSHGIAKAPSGCTEGKEQAFVEQSTAARLNAHLQGVNNIPWSWGTSLVVQWLRICLSVQEMWAPSLVGELRSHIVVAVVWLLSQVQLFATPWTAASQASLSFTISQSLLKLMSIESVMPSNHLILCYPLLLLSSIFPSISIFSNESALLIRWPKYWSFSFSIGSSNEYSGLISFRIGQLDFLAIQGTL